MTQKPLPIIGITMGDPAGIGAEIVCKSIMEPKVLESCRPVVIGSKKPLEKALDTMGSAQRVCIVEDPLDADYSSEKVNLIDIPMDYDFSPGVMDVGNGRVSIAYMEKAYELIAAGKVNGTASAPCNKAAMKKAGLPCVGATEFYAMLAGVEKSFAVIEQADCYIFQATAHISLRNAIEKITPEFIHKTIITAYKTLQQWGLAAPRLALSGFNPHAGDGGSMGREELEMLAPAIESASRELGCEIGGPVPADSIYIKGIQGVYDGIIFLFHDTANIPVKLMEQYYPSVVITGGLPFIRTTVAHGTAYDIAYKGIASHKQMSNAILAAARIGGRLLAGK